MTWYVKLEDMKLGDDSLNITLQVRRDTPEVLLHFSRVFRDTDFTINSIRTEVQAFIENYELLEIKYNGFLQFIDQEYEL